MTWGRAVVAAIALCSLAVGCGDNDNTFRRSDDVAPGFFIGETADGGDLSIAIGSVRAIFFGCGGTNIYRRFDPPEPVSGDGSFAVDFEASGSRFIVTGELVTDDRIVGAIAGNSDCDGPFTAERCDDDEQECGDRDDDLIPDEIDPVSGTTPTPFRTPTPGAGRTSTAAATGAATPTAAVTATAAATVAASPTPAPTSTPTGPCGNGVLDEGEECDGAVIDNGFCFEDVCTCEDFCDDAGGALSCNANCTLNFSQCASPPCEF
jgi:hypothetical protein